MKLSYFVFLSFMTLICGESGLIWDNVTFCCVYVCESSHLSFSTRWPFFIKFCINVTSFESISISNFFRLPTITSTIENAWTCEVKKQTLVYGPEIMYADGFFKNVQSFFSFKKQRTEIAKIFCTFRFDGNTKQIIYLGKSEILHEVGIAM